MPGPYPLPTLSAVVTATGISAPSFADILASLQASYMGIYGSDVVLDNSTQDGQWIAVQAKAIDDCNSLAISVYNAYSPSTAQGAGLSSIVKTNGIERESPSNSTADLTLVGNTGVILTNAVVSDGTYDWELPASVTFPGGGSIVVTSTCTTPGAITAAVNTITQIQTPTLGWFSATNAAAATPGAPVEDDAELRVRQSASVAIAALTPLEAIVAAVGNVSGVTSVTPYENDTNTTDGNGLPAHSISLVVTGGDDTAIAEAIAAKKLGTGTYGTTSVLVLDQNGVPTTINFFRPTVMRVIAQVTLTPLANYVSTTGTALVAVLAAYVSSLANGADVYQSKAESSANLPGNPLTNTFNITQLELAFYGNSLAVQDLTIAFNQQASLAVADITLVT